MSARIKSEALAGKAVRAPVRRWFMVPMRVSEIVEATHEPRLHRDNCLLQVQHRIVLASSWFRCAIVRSWKLPMNQPLSRPAATLSPPCGERAGRGETRRGSWPQLTSYLWRCSLSMNLLRVADPRSGARLCEAQRFMVPMRVQSWVEAFHEPGGARFRRAVIKLTARIFLPRLHQR